MGHLFAISDIHGCFDPFYSLVVRQIKLSKSDKLILLGDYIDRGPKSKDVIDFIIDLTDKGFDVTPLAGNHEEMLIDSWNNPDLLPLWLINSGRTTMQNFGIQNINDIDKKYYDFFRSLKYFKKAGKFLFSHAGFNDEAPDPFADKHGMIWEVRKSYKNPKLRGKTIIHGHRPKTIEFVKKLIHEKSRVIPIDTGCVYNDVDEYGYLSALDVGKMKLVSVKNTYYEKTAYENQ
jgi:serine/threonine protein phosphatase 1